MKMLFTIVLLHGLALPLMAQTSGAGIIPDTLHQIIMHCYSFKGKPEPLYVIDGKIKPKLEDSLVSKIASISILNPKRSQQAYGVAGKKGAIVVLTKDYMIRHYQQKLSKFSREYKLFLKEHNHNDTSVYYVKNGNLIDYKDRINILYEIPAESIRSVVYIFTDKYRNGPPASPIVAIILK